jgi:UDP:flavonoid glycosyltransferase YjiC (YdhE family)
LPLWVDLYNFSRMAEYLGVGIWLGKDTAPDWDPLTLSKGLLQALDNETGLAMRGKAEALGEVARRYGGRDAAAAELARLAAGGI